MATAATEKSETLLEDLFEALVKHLLSVRYCIRHTKEDTDARYLNIKKTGDAGGTFTLEHCGGGKPDIDGILQFRAFPFGTECDYFEVKILKQTKAIGIGLAGENYDLLHFPGWDEESIGFHTDDGGLFHESGTPTIKDFSDKPKEGDTIGCGVIYSAELELGKVKVFFTCNGRKIGSPVPVSRPRKGTFFALIAIQHFGDRVQVAIGPRSHVHWQFREAARSGMSGLFRSFLGLYSRPLAWKEARRRNITCQKAGVCYDLTHQGDSGLGAVSFCGFPFGATVNYFEVKILKQKEGIGIGLAAENYSLEFFPGCKGESVAFRTNNGRIYHKSEIGRYFAKSAKEGDVVGCGIDYSSHQGAAKREIFFTCNGSTIGSVTVNIPKKGAFFAIVALTSSREKAQVAIGPKSKETWKFSKNMTSQCQYQTQCREFVLALDVQPNVFYKEFDKCYCSICYTEDDWYYRGIPPKRYGMPKGWVRFGIKVDGGLEANKIFKNYHVAFHGTSPHAVKSILESRQLLLPGDTTTDGKEIDLPKNHIKDGRNSLIPVPGQCGQFKVAAKHPEKCSCGCEVYMPNKMFFTSPSIKYCENPAYAREPFEFRGHTYKTVLQVRQKPDSYKVLNETVCATERIDPLFDNSEIEWCTRQRYPTIVITGLLIKKV